MTHSDEVSDERLAEMLAGLEGVTPGPWYHSRKHEDADILGPNYEIGSADRAIAGQMYALTAAHIARCDPETMRAILTELLSRRSASNTAGGGVKDEIASLVAQHTPSGLPRAYGNCTCSCHRQPGVMHIAPCCRPGDDATKPLITREWFERRARAEDGLDISVGPVSALEPIQAGGDEPVAWQHKLTSIIRYDRPNSYDLAQGDYAPLFTRPATPVSAEVTEIGMTLTVEQVAIMDRLDGALCQYLNNVGDEWDDPRWLESVRRNLDDLAKAYNDCHVAKIMDLREARAALATLDRGRG